MFFGSVYYTLDEKGRVLLPPRFRLRLGERFIVTCGMHRCLWVYTTDAWHKIAAKLGEGGDFNLSAAVLARVFGGGCEEVTPDSQGRITIPQPLREYAGLRGDVVILGAVNRVEIWSKERWSEYCDRLDDGALENAARELNLA